MKLSEMIKVMQHFEDGGDVVFSEDNFETILGKANKQKNPNGLSWDWFSLQYRIKEPKQKITIEKWLMQNTADKIYSIIESSNVDKYKHYEKVKLIKSYEVELWKLNY